MTQDKTEKLHVLAVLEDGVSRNAWEILVRLDEWFGLRSSVNALRKNLYMCLKQDLLERSKLLGGSYRYSITEKGKKRLELLRARREKAPSECVEAKEPDEKATFDRWLEVATSIRLSDTVSNLVPDNFTSSVATWGRVYWRLECMKLLPYLPAHMLPVTWQFLSGGVPSKAKGSSESTDLMLTSFTRTNQEFEHLFSLREEEKKEKERYKRLYEEKEAECRKLGECLEAKVGVDVNRGQLDLIFSAGLRLGRVFGRFEAAVEQTLSIQKIVLRRIQTESAERQKQQEHFDARLQCDYFNNR